jgi:outer membrane protein OmpA-like peptidoglycan-associated protein
MHDVAHARRGLGRVAGGLLLVSVIPALAACGGVIKFEDRSAIAIGSTAPKAAVPPPVESRVALEKDRITIKEKIMFAYNDDEILPQSFSLLDEIATVIKNNPQVKQLEIGGHASTEGDDGRNMDLSKRRANAVMVHLVTKGGVAKDRVIAKGYGETKPLVKPDDTDAQKELNRRVEFLVLQQDAAAAPAAQAAK